MATIQEYKHFVNKMMNYSLRKADFVRAFGPNKNMRDYYLEHQEECEAWLEEGHLSLKQRLGREFDAAIDAVYGIKSVCRFDKENVSVEDLIAIAKKVAFYLDIE